MIDRALLRSLCTTTRTSGPALNANMTCRTNTAVQMEKSVEFGPDWKFGVLHRSQVSEKSRVHNPTLVLKKIGSSRPLSHTITTGLAWDVPLLYRPLPVTDMPTLLKHGYAGAASRFDARTRGGEYRGPNAGPQTSKASHKLSLSSVVHSVSVPIRLLLSQLLVSSELRAQTQSQPPWQTSANSLKTSMSRLCSSRRMHTKTHTLPLIPAAQSIV
jgi:hypothetical protein